jgi:hypothetical protein
VVIPRANVQHLMLKPEVVEACGMCGALPCLRRRARVDEALELLTGVPAGATAGRTAASRPIRSTNACVARLHELAEIGRKHSGTRATTSHAGKRGEAMSAQTANPKAATRCAASCWRWMR